MAQPHPQKTSAAKRKSERFTASISPWALACTLFMAFSATLLPLQATASERILLQSTTSTQNSGLYEVILPQFEAESGMRVDVVAVGTGQAIKNAENGDGDVLIVHSKDAEEAFVAAGHGVARFDLMYNDFVIIGPRADPAGLRQAQTLEAALHVLQGGAARFVSRGDDSGTHLKERALWHDAGIDMSSFGAWYIDAGSGMGATLRLAVDLDAYTLSDRGTWIAFGSPADHAILYEGDPALFNQYGIIAVNPLRHPHVNAAGVKRFMDWMLGPQGQAAIAAYRVNGLQLFFPNAAPQ